LVGSFLMMMMIMMRDGRIMMVIVTRLGRLKINETIRSGKNHIDSCTHHSANTEWLQPYHIMAYGS
jgi:hypothetical protein